MREDTQSLVMSGYFTLSFRVHTMVHRTIFHPVHQNLSPFSSSPACHAWKDMVILASIWTSVCFFVLEAHRLRHPRPFRGESRRTNRAGAPRA